MHIIRLDAFGAPSEYHVSMVCGSTSQHQRRGSSGASCASHTSHQALTCVMDACSASARLIWSSWNAICSVLRVLTSSVKLFCTCTCCWAPAREMGTKAAADQQTMTPAAHSESITVNDVHNEQCWFMQQQQAAPASAARCAVCTTHQRSLQQAPCRPTGSGALHPHLQLP